MIVRDGLVAVRRIPSQPQFIHLSNGNEYVFSMQHNISLAWVKEEDVPAVLAIKKGCCGGVKRPVFHLSDETHVRRFENGGR